VALGRKLANLLRSLGHDDAELSILFVGDRAMRTLNRRYRGKDKTTDVLSFPFRGPLFPQIHPHVLGDIVISVPQANRQALAEGHPVGREIETLLVHGLLHLLGYDHERSAWEALRMKRREIQLLKRLPS
jgi:rRNA maturation RNase YbeY